MTTDERALPDTARTVLELAVSLAVELQPRLASARDISLDSRLDGDLGLDSLSRLELVSRLEKRFSVRLAEEVFSEAETPRDLLLAVLRADVATAPLIERLSLVQHGDDADLPIQAVTLTGVLDWHASRHPERTHIRLYSDSGDDRVIGVGLRRVEKSMRSQLEVDRT